LRTLGRHGRAEPQGQDGKKGNDDQTVRFHFDLLFGMIWTAPNGSRLSRRPTEGRPVGSKRRLGGEGFIGSYAHFCKTRLTSHNRLVQG